MMDELRLSHGFPVAVMCEVLDVSRSGYYASKRRPPSARKQEDERLKPVIKAAHERGRGTYGAEKLQKEVADVDGITIGMYRLKRLRRELRLKCLQKRKFRATTDSSHELPIAPNVLEQNFEVAAPNKAWVADITYIPTDEGWLYLAGIKDLCTCEIVGYEMSGRMTQDLVGRALFRAVKAKRPPAGLIHHSDRGSQYCSNSYRKLLRQFGILSSMSRKGNCWDNAPMESFFGTMKVELVHHRRYRTREEAAREIREYIEVFYNRQRRHAKLGNVSPAAFQRNYYDQIKAA